MSNFKVGDFVRANIYGQKMEYGEITMILNVPLAQRDAGSIEVYVVNGFLVQLDKLKKVVRHP